MRLLLTPLLLLTLALLASSQAQTAGVQLPSKDLQTLYNRHDWHSLREASRHQNVPLFYRAAVEAAFDDYVQAEKDLKAIEKNGTVDQQYEALEMSVNLHFRHGFYREALDELHLMLKERPQAEDVRRTIPLLKALSSNPDQTTVRCRTSTIPAHMEQGNLFVPVQIKNSSAQFILDSGANFSLMSFSEAKRLGLGVEESQASVGDASGTKIGMKVANAPDLKIGGLHLRNVRFGVVPDSQEPFVDLPAGNRAILGIPVLLSMRALRWTAAGTFTSCFKTSEHQEPNVSFVGMFPVTQIWFQNKSLSFTIDMGAIRTDLDPSFATDFPKLISDFGQKEQHRITGVGGTTSYDAVLLPSLVLDIGGHDVHLTPAHVLLKGSNGTGDWADGNLGMDLLTQSRITTLDFMSMSLRLQ